jgi:hypothetical protein
MMGTVFIEVLDWLELFHGFETVPIFGLSVASAAIDRLPSSKRLRTFSGACLRLQLRHRASFLVGSYEGAAI